MIVRRFRVLALAVVLAIASPLGLLAADLDRVHTSAKALVDGVEEMVRPAFVQESYLPGYGYHVAAEPAEQLEDATIRNLRQHLQEQAASIEGLESEDWVSISSTCCLIRRSQEIILRVKPNDSETSIQYWINGEIQPASE